MEPSLPASPHAPSPPAKDWPPPALAKLHAGAVTSTEAAPAQPTSLELVSPKTTVEERPHAPPAYQDISQPTFDDESVQRQQQAKLQAAAIAHMQAQAQAEAHVRAAEEEAKAQQSLRSRGPGQDRGFVSMAEASPRTPAARRRPSAPPQPGSYTKSSTKALPRRSFSTESILRSRSGTAEGQALTKIQTATSFDQGDITRRKDQLQTDMLRPRTSDAAGAREQVHRESVIMAEVKTNVIVSLPVATCCSVADDEIRDEFLFLNDLSQHLAQRFQRPTSAVFVTLDHSACLLFAGSFDSAYILTITALPTQLQPTTNKRNAALTQSFLATALGVLPDRGIIRFNAISEESLAISGTTIHGQIERMQKSAAGMASPHQASLSISRSTTSLAAPTSVLSPLQPAAPINVATNQSSFSQASTADVAESRPASAATQITTPDHVLYDDQMQRSSSLQSNCPSHYHSSRSDAGSVAPAPAVAPSSQYPPVSARIRARTTSRSRPGKISILPMSASTPNSRLQTPIESNIPRSAASSTSSFFQRSGRSNRNNSSSIAAGHSYDALGNHGGSRSASTPGFHMSRWQRRNKDRPDLYERNASYDYDFQYDGPDRGWRGDELHPPALTPDRYHSEKKTNKRMGKRKSFLGFFRS